MQRHAHSNEALLQLMLDLSGVGAQDSVVDLACGPGIVSCSLHARSVTGLDFVPAMLERARKLQAERGLTESSSGSTGRSQLFPSQIAASIA